jgi:hypothetical protein
MWRSLVLLLWVWLGILTGCSKAPSQGVIETAVAGTLTARPTDVIATVRPAATLRPTTGVAAVPTAAATPPTRRSPATSTPTPPSATTEPGDAEAGCLRWNEAKNYDGQTQCVCGPVVDATYAAKSNGAPTFLNLGEKSSGPNRFTVVIWGDQRANFETPPEQLYRGKTICVTGRITLYKGIAETQAKSPSEIEVE